MGSNLDKHYERNGEECRLLANSILTGRRVTVSFHRSRITPPGTLLNMLREAGISRDDLERMS